MLEKHSPPYYYKEEKEKIGLMLETPVIQIFKDIFGEKNVEKATKVEDEKGRVPPYNKEQPKVDFWLGRPLEGGKPFVAGIQLTCTGEKDVMKKKIRIHSLNNGKAYKEYREGSILNTKEPCEVVLMHVPGRSAVKIIHAYNLWPKKTKFLEHFTSYIDKSINLDKDEQERQNSRIIINMFHEIIDENFGLSMESREHFLKMLSDTEFYQKIRNLKSYKKINP